MVNTLERDDKNRNGRFRPLPELVDMVLGNPNISTKFSQNPDIFRTGELVEGFRFTVIANGDGYMLWGVDQQDPCYFTFFSNQEGAIYEGYPVSVARRR